MLGEAELLAVFGNVPNHWRESTGSPDELRDDAGADPGAPADPMSPACHHGRLTIVQAIPRALVPPASTRDPP